MLLTQVVAGDYSVSSLLIRFKGLGWAEDLGLNNFHVKKNCDVQNQSSDLKLTIIIKKKSTPI